ncbi:hypothetical protein HYX02_01985 [Candidatus Woesearchaeota archaeon]|nr:hypothetical protein [Candidatus Woesearchaeota archaeon]
MEFISKNTIKLDKEINELDKLVFEFINILKKHTDYVIVSGYVAILLGRSRTTEDIDVFIKELDKQKFKALYRDLQKKWYWCLNGENPDELYDYLKDGLAIRFALEPQTTPNFEIKFARKILDLGALQDTLKVIIKDKELKISSLERQIAFKRYYLKSDKDLEDASHIEKLFKEEINKSRIEEYKKLIENEMAKTGKR